MHTYLDIKFCTIHSRLMLPMPNLPSNLNFYTDCAQNMHLFMGIVIAGRRPVQEPAGAVGEPLWFCHTGL